MQRAWLYIILMMICFTSCKKEYIFDLSGGKPIQFSQTLGVETKSGTTNGSVATMNGKSFGVRAYIYDKTWDSEEVLAKPDPNWQNVEVRCETNGSCSYATPPKYPVKYWETSKRYAFFGYYPCNYNGLNNQGTMSPDPQKDPLITLSAPSITGSPKLTYTLRDEALGIGIQDGIGDFNAMYDVMYGSVIDANDVLNSTVELPFKHALYAIQVVIENFGKDTVLISDLKVTFQIKRKKMEIPMNGDAPIFEDLVTPISSTFHFIKEQNNEIEKVASTLNNPPHDVSHGKYLLLIPQFAMDISAKVKVKNADNTTTEHTIKNISFPNTDLIAGNRYMFDIQFIGDKLNAILIQGSEWVDKPSDIEFE